jgi:hypothetical protein
MENLGAWSSPRSRDDYAARVQTELLSEGPRAELHRARRYTATELAELVNVARSAGYRAIACTATGLQARLFGSPTNGSVICAGSYGQAPTGACIGCSTVRSSFW